MMELTPRERLLYLAESGGYTPAELRSLAFFWQEYPYDEPREILRSFRKRDKRSSRALHFQRDQWEAQQERNQKQDVRAITLLDEAYPKAFLEMADPPAAFCCSGNLELLSRRSLAIVGSREATGYGRQVLERLLPGLLQEGIVIVSGLAAGIDSMVHRQTIRLGGQTVGVIGTGLGRAYPAQSQSLQQEMMENQLIISEFPYYAGPRREHFPQRNRLIAGLTQATLVIQAKERSGSLITANYALQYNREVFAVPGSILEEQSRGTNQLIQAGAKAILHAYDILDEMQYIWNL